MQYKKLKKVGGRDMTITIEIRKPKLHEVFIAGGVIFFLSYLIFGR